MERSLVLVKPDAMLKGTAELYLAVCRKRAEAGRPQDAAHG